jgi:hypothetical protein
MQKMNPRNSINGAVLAPEDWSEYLNRFFSAEAVKSIENAVAAVFEPPPGGAVDEYYSALESTEDPGELIEHRFLCRGATCLLVGPTGVGKSSFVTQLAFHFAAGLECLGFRPVKQYRSTGMKVLLVQAENDRFDMLEMVNGIRAGSDAIANDTRAAKQLQIYNLRGVTGERFIQILNSLLAECGPFDLAIIDNALAYLGTDAKGQKEVGHFLRELLDPVVQKHNVGLILCHHSNKPPTGREKPEWQAGDFAYIGSGSSEWANFARAIIALRNIGSSEIFELMVPKRGSRLRWKNGEENTTRTHIRHAREAGKIYWEAASAEEIQALESENQKVGRPKSAPDPAEVLHCIDARPGLSRKAYTDIFGAIHGVSRRTLDGLIVKCLDKGWLRYREKSLFKYYNVTEGGRNYAKERPSVFDWPAHWQNLDAAKDTDEKP